MNNKAFSLVELLAVLVIIGVILLLFIPNIADLFTEFKDKDQVKILQNSAISAAKYYVSDVVSGEINDINISNINCTGDTVEKNISINVNVKNNLIANKYLESNDYYKGDHNIKVTYDCNLRKFKSYSYID